MKYLCAVISSLIVTMPVYAKPVDLFIDNRTGQDITLESGNISFTVPGNTQIKNQLLEDNSHVVSKVNNKIQCSWNIVKRASNGNVLDGIGYFRINRSMYQCMHFVHTENK